MASAAVVAKADVMVAVTAIAAMVAVANVAVNVVVSATSLKRLSAMVNVRLNARPPRPALKVAVVDAATVRRTAARPRRVLLSLPLPLPLRTCRAAVVVRRASAARHPKWPRWPSRMCNPVSRTPRPRRRKVKVLRPRPSAKAAAAAVVAVVAVTAKRHVPARTGPRPKVVMPLP